MKEGKPIWGVVGLAIVIVAVAAVVWFAINHNRPSEITPGAAEIVLNTNGGVPYEWKYEIADDSIVQYDGMRSESQNEGVAGGPVKEYHKFKAVKEGETDITFKYVNFADGSDEAEEVKNYRAVVDRDLKIEITEKE